MTSGEAPPAEDVATTTGSGPGLLPPAVRAAALTPDALDAAVDRIASVDTRAELPRIGAAVPAEWPTVVTDILRRMQAVGS